MTQTSRRTRAVPRRTVPATQHERLAQVSLQFAERQIGYFGQLVALIRYVVRDRPVTRSDWDEQNKALILALETAERFQAEAEGERGFFDILYQDARGITFVEPTGEEAVEVLAEAHELVMHD